VSNRSMRRAFFLLLLTFFVAGCSRGVDVERALKVTDVHTGWYDAGLQPDGKNKLVPSISLKLQNVSEEPVRSVQLMAVFRRVGDAEAWDDTFVRGIGREPLQPGGTTPPLVLHANAGYKGEQARIQMLQNKEFVDARVEVLGKHGPRTWVKIGEYPIDRQLLTQ
jgi:hypothetical protein